MHLPVALCHGERFQDCVASLGLPVAVHISPMPQSQNCTGIAIRKVSVRAIFHHETYSIPEREPADEVDEELLAVKIE